MSVPEGLVIAGDCDWLNHEGSLPINWGVCTLACNAK